MKNSTMCGCYYCQRTFSSTKIKHFVDQNVAVCPECAVDSVIYYNDTEHGSTKNFKLKLKALYKKNFLNKTGYDAKDWI